MSKRCRCADVGSCAGAQSMAQSASAAACRPPLGNSPREMWAIRRLTPVLHAGMAAMGFLAYSITLPLFT